MTTRSLSDKLSELSDEQVLWLSPDGRATKAGSLKASINAIDPSKWFEKHVVLGDISAMDLAESLVYLDGIASQIDFCPTELLNSPKIFQGVEIDETQLQFVNSSILRGNEVQTDISQNGQCNKSRKGVTAKTETAWVLYTSGTTGTPKRINHSLRSLTRSTLRSRLQKQYVWASLYELRRFAGLQVFLQAWYSGTPLLLPGDPLDLDTMIDAMISAKCNALSATPSMWRKIAMHPQFDWLHFDRITLGGEIADQHTLNLLKNHFPQAKISHIYASTEAGVGFSVKDGIAGFPVEYLQPKNGWPEMKIDANNHLLFRNRSHPNGNEDHFLDSGDVVEVRGSRVYFCGRSNGSINVGGNKVMPEEVEAVLLELSEVGMVQVRARKSSMLGNLVEAVVVPAAGFFCSPDFKAKLLAHCRARLDAYKVPAFIIEAKELNMTRSGKLSRTESA